MQSSENHGAGAPENRPDPAAQAEAREAAQAESESQTEAREAAQAEKQEAAQAESEAQAQTQEAAQAEARGAAADERRARIRKEAREWVVSIAVALIAVFLIRSFLFTVIRVDGSSMKETLHDGERLIVTVLDVKLHGVQRDDVVICHFPDRTGFLGLKENFVKRVIGVGGDQIVMLNGDTYVNGVRVDEPFVTHPSPMINGGWEVPEGYVFVCGDNRNGSHDSRSADVGFIAESEIVGKVRLVMWPVGSWRIVS